jgi:hypothetical protein
MDYEFNHARKRDQNKFVTLGVTLKVWPGQKIPANADLTGLTITRILGGIGRAILDGSGIPVTIGSL